MEEQIGNLGFGLVDRVFANCRVIQKTLKMVLDTPLLNTQQYNY